MVQPRALKLWELELLFCPESLCTGMVGQPCLAGEAEYHGPSGNFTPAFLNRASVLCKKRGRSVGI